MRDRWKETISWRRAMAWVGLSVVLVTGSITVVSLFYHTLIHMRSNDPRYQLTHINPIAQSEMQLPTSFFSKLFNLSDEHPQNFYRFDLEDANQKLRAHPLFKKGRVYLIAPNEVQVVYSLRTPIAVIANLERAFIDEEGVIFPLVSVFRTDNLPKLFLKEREMEWGKAIHGSDWNLAKQILFHSAFSDELLRIQWLDVSRLQHPQYGKREVPLLVKNIQDKSLSWVRLPKREVLKRLPEAAYVLKLEEGERLIDLRIEKLALVKELSIEENEGWSSYLREQSNG